MSMLTTLIRWISVLALMLGCATPAFAVDGCKVLLCFAGNWRDISECRPEVERALKDQAKGKGWPTCNTTQANSAVQTENSIVPITIYGPACPYWAREWEFIVDSNYNTYDNKVYGSWRMSCKVNQIMAVTIDSQPWKKSYVMPDGSALDEWLPAALAAMPEADTISNSVGQAEAAWAAAGSPTTAPTWLLPANYVVLNSGVYRACPPFTDDPNTCNWFDDGVYVPW